MQIVLSGGGTGGSITPLLAIAEKIREKNKEKKIDTDFLFFGTRQGGVNGIERRLANKVGIKFYPVICGRFRRYLTWKNLVDPFLVIIGFFQSIFLLLKFCPKAILSAGGFTAVPVAWAGWLLGIPIFIHQQDLLVGLANKLMVPIATKITINFDQSLKEFPRSKAILTGNPVRDKILKGNKQKALDFLGFSPELLTILVIGGGTGAKQINSLVIQSLPRLTEFCQIIHLTGKGKQIELKNIFKIKNNSNQQTKNRYRQFDFIDQELPDIFALANLVISRAGLGVLTELAALGKPAIIIPIINSHQEANARYFVKHQAIIYLKENTNNQSFVELFINQIKRILENTDQRAQLSLNISKLFCLDATNRIAQVVLDEIN